MTAMMDQLTSQHQIQAPGRAEFFDLTGKSALVTGAGRGLGRAIALRLARAGASVCVNDLDKTICDGIVAEIADFGGNACGYAANVTAEGEVERMIAAVAAKQNGIDILVNNAGISRAETILETSLESWNEVMSVNLAGSFLCSKYAIMNMKAQGRGGRIVMVGSVVGHQGALKGWVHYGASKSGLHGLAKTLVRTAAEFAVTVNCVSPGIVDTEMLTASHGNGVSNLIDLVPLDRLANTEDVAAAVHFLASDDAGYITGANIDINGGMYIRA
jgi:3-oxoacyl-[acyl-carrier protein] reductase